MDFEAIRETLERLRTATPPPEVFGAKLHRFILNPPLPEAEVRAFEEAHRITLPADYRRFLIEVGNGGAGPNYGLFPLGHAVWRRDLVAWTENDGSIGILSEPFPHTEPWNNLGSRPVWNDSYTEELYEDHFSGWRDQYFNCRLMDGALPISDVGCSVKHWLVVTGPEAGHVWCDGRADLLGIFPLTFGELPRANFLQWYTSWLQEILGEPGPCCGIPPLPEAELRRRLRFE